MHGVGCFEGGQLSVVPVLACFSLYVVATSGKSPESTISTLSLDVLIGEMETNFNFYLSEDFYEHFCEDVFFTKE
jgi:hypothetical protein